MNKRLVPLLALLLPVSALSQEAQAPLAKVLPEGDVERPQPAALSIGNEISKFPRPPVVALALDLRTPVLKEVAVESHQDSATLRPRSKARRQIELTIPPLRSALTPLASTCQTVVTSTGQGESLHVGLANDPLHNWVARQSDSKSPGAVRAGGNAMCAQRDASMPSPWD